MYYAKISKPFPWIISFIIEYIYIYIYIHTHTHTSSSQKFLATSEKKSLAEHFCCGNTLKLLIFFFFLYYFFCSALFLSFIPSKIALSSVDISHNRSLFFTLFPCLLLLTHFLSLFSLIFHYFFLPFYIFFLPLVLTSFIFFFSFILSNILSSFF